MGVLHNIESTNGNVNIGYIRRKVDWLCAILTRFGNNSEDLDDSLLSHMREAQSILANLTLLHLFAFKHKPQTFLSVCLRFTT